MYDKETPASAGAPLRDASPNSDVDPFGEAASGQSAELQAETYPLEVETRMALADVVEVGPQMIEGPLAGASAQAAVVQAAVEVPSDSYATAAVALVDLVQGVDDWIDEASGWVADAEDEQADDPDDLKLVNRAADATWAVADARATLIPTLAEKIVIPGTSTDELPDFATALARIKKGDPLDTVPTLAELANVEGFIVADAVALRAAGAAIVEPADGKEVTVDGLIETYRTPDEHHLRYLLSHLIQSGAHLEAVNQVADGWKLSTADFVDELAGLLDWAQGVAVEDVPRDTQHVFLRDVGIAAYKSGRQQAKAYKFAVFGEAYAGMVRALNAAKTGEPGSTERAAAAVASEFDWRVARVTIAATLEDFRNEEGAPPDMVKYASEGIANIDRRVAENIAKNAVDTDAALTGDIAIDNEVANQNALAELKVASRAFVSCHAGLKKSLKDYPDKWAGPVFDEGGNFGLVLKFAKDIYDVGDASVAAGKAQRAGLISDADEETVKMLIAVGGIMKDVLEEVLERGMEKLKDYAANAATAALAKSAQHLSSQYRGCLDMLGRGVGTLLALPALFFAIKKLVNLPDDAGGQAEADAIMGVVGAGGAVISAAAGISAVPVGIAVASVHLTWSIMGQLGGMLGRIHNDALAQDVKRLVEQARKSAKSLTRAHAAQERIRLCLSSGGTSGFDAKLRAEYEKIYIKQVGVASVDAVGLGDPLQGRALRKSGAHLAFAAHAAFIDIKEGAPVNCSQAYKKGMALSGALPDLFNGVERVTRSAAKKMQ